MDQTNHFFNIGYGWLCKHCAAEAAERRQHSQRHDSTQTGQYNSDLPLASWADSSRQALTCHRCGIQENISGRS